MMTNFMQETIGERLTKTDNFFVIICCLCVYATDFLNPDVTEFDELTKTNLPVNVVKPAELMLNPIRLS